MSHRHRDKKQNDESTSLCEQGGRYPRGKTNGSNSEEERFSFLAIRRRMLYLAIRSIFENLQAAAPAAILIRELLLDRDLGGLGRR